MTVPRAKLIGTRLYLRRDKRVDVRPTGRDRSKLIQHLAERGLNGSRVGAVILVKQAGSDEPAWISALTT